MHPIFFQVGPVAIRYYSLMIIMGVVAGTLFAQREARRRGWDPDMIIDFALYGVISGILGARLYYVIFQWPQYAAMPSEIPKIWHGGLAIHGGWIAGIIVSILFCRARKISFWEFTDVMAPVLLLGQAFGRIGNLMNGDAHGVPTLMPWGLRFPAGTAAFYDPKIPHDTVFKDYTVPLHPTMIYENIWNLTGFLWLWAIRKQALPTGTSFGLTLIWTGVGRAIVEAFRGDSLMLGNIKMAQVIGVIYVIVGVGIILYRREVARQHPEDTVQSRPEPALATAGDAPGLTVNMDAEPPSGSPAPERPLPSHEPPEPGASASETAGP